jgi:hypothetical protein
MRRIRIAMVALCTCGFASACASAPISVVGSEFVASDVDVAPAQLTLRTAADDLEMAYSRNGWSQAANAMQAAQRWIGRLAGRDAPDAELEPVDQADLATLEIMEMDGDDAVVRLASDLRTADALANQVNAAARELTVSGSELSRSSLTRDLGHIERTIAHTMHALTFFDSVIDGLADRLTPSQLRRIQRGRDQLASRSERLQDRADDIAEMRRIVRHHSFS